MSETAQLKSGSAGAVPALSLRDIRRSFPQPEGELAVLKGCTTEIRAGELVAMVGTIACNHSRQSANIAGRFVHFASNSPRTLPYGGSVNTRSTWGNSGRMSRQSAW